ncbi:TnsA endonuclease N-terminal domain-containing protein [Yersinia massiliensis]|uniref:Heteromeric transposase endonuclease subunit TnsA n=1 Tax=Yersinia massiliensis TaxID=419257 RepID=A0AA90XYY9_9GAMM|nr:MULTISPECIES: TnsA endonuclease N-terminal domain-containing protein [Yersinia]MDA5547911.1 TnsA endonuclease N-terminal domain-containing protein [Yersinia massiliensis]NIL27942.1 heteromeric transposase endonuclease subunit TnsA [Yersinia massiliensis]UZM79245.1 TnsA endonuclease N-terminal domain-containing protein [Yersinia massiliensis]CNG85988.1 TnsA endonuclease [Yersinia frederiksenii]
MGKGRKLETLGDYQRALKDKYGIGAGVEYKPWLRVQDVKSQGVRSQVFGRKVPRVHHFLSSLETQFFYLAEFTDDVIDIREQFPLLPLNVSQKIAKTIGVEHPTHPNTGEPIIVTTDFLLTLQTVHGERYQAVSVKPESEFKNQRSLEKIDIERIWWELLGVNFKYFTGNELTCVQSKNINWATSPFRQQVTMFSGGQIEHALSTLQIGKCFVHDLCDCFYSKNITNKDNSLTLVRYLIASKFISIDLSVNIENAGIIDITGIQLSRRGMENGNY